MPSSRFGRRRDQLYHNKTNLVVDLAHIRAWNEYVADMLETRPTEVLPLVRPLGREHAWLSKVPSSSIDTLSWLGLTLTASFP